MLSCHGAPHNSVSSPYSPLSEKDATLDNTTGDNEEDTSLLSLNHSPSAKKGVAKARAGAMSGALLMDTSDTVDISDSNSMAAFAPEPLPAPSSSRRFNRKDLAISTPSSKSLHPLGLLSSQHSNTSLVQSTPPSLQNPLQGVAQSHDIRFVDSNAMMFPPVFVESPIAWDAAMGLPSPSTTGMTRSATTSTFYSTASPSLPLLQTNDIVGVGEKNLSRSTPPSTASNGPATQRRSSLVDNGVRRSWTTRTLGGMDDNPLPTPTEQDFVFMDPSTLRVALSTPNAQQELTAILAAASLPTPVSAVSTCRSLLPSGDSTNSSLLAHTFAQNGSISATGVQPAINNTSIDLGLPVSSSLPADLARQAALSLPLYDGKSAAAASQVSQQQPLIANGLSGPSTMKVQQPPVRRGSKAGRPGVPKAASQGSGYIPMPAQALSVPGAPWPHAGGVSIPPVPPFAPTVSLEQAHSSTNGAQTLQQQPSTGSTTNDLLGFHTHKQHPFKPYHGPAPCGNPDPLYEYLASPTIVPGLEIIGHDYYGNYVQVLPICPDTSCSMNQDPIYLNLLQAIYAHTIPFLDLPPCSEEESRILLSGLSPSAIHPQSVQPPFLHLLPPKLPARGGANDPTRGWSGYYQTTLGGQTSVMNDNDAVGSMRQPTSLTSLAALLGPSSSTTLSTGPSLNRRASLPSFPPSSQMVSNTSLLPPTNGRRSSTGSFPATLGSNINPNTNPNNPARKKKNMPRTHPYKSTSSHRDDNSMVMDTIMALSSSKSCGASVSGGLASLLGESRDVPDPKRKVIEKMVHMDETEYANHYLKHQRSMRKSASTTAVSLVQTLATAAQPTISKLSSLGTSSHASGSQKQQSATHGSRRPPQAQEKQLQQEGSANTATTSQDGSLAAMVASDFIRAMTRPQYLHSSTNTLPTPATTVNSAQNDPNWALTAASAAELAELEKMMMSMDSTAMAAVQAAASVISWPKWVDFKQLEQDMCESQVGSSNNAADSTSFSGSNIDNNGSDNQEAPKLLLSSSTDLDMLDDPMMTEDTMAMTSLSLSDKTPSSPTTSSSPSSAQQQDARWTKSEQHPAAAGDMDCDDPVSSFAHLQSKASSGTHELPPLPKQLCDPLPPSSPGSLMAQSVLVPPLAQAKPKRPQQPQPQLSQPPVDSMERLAEPYTSTILTVLPFAPEHSRPIFPTRGARRTGWYRSKAVASRGLSAITGVDYTTTCWYNVEQLEQIIKESIAASPITEVNPLDGRTLEALTDPSASSVGKSTAT